MIKNPIISLRKSAEFSNQTLLSKGVKVASAVLCSLIKHAKTILVRIVQIILLANEATAVNHKLDFS